MVKNDNDELEGIERKSYLKYWVERSYTNCILSVP